MSKTVHIIEFSEEAEALAKYAKALGHPTRLLILKYLNNQNCCYTSDLVEKFPEARQNCASKLRFLKDDFEKAIQEPIVWNFETPTAETAVLSIEKHGLTTMNREHWPLIFEFFYVNMSQLEHVFESSRDFLET